MKEVDRIVPPTSPAGLPTAAPPTVIVGSNRSLLVGTAFVGVWVVQAVRLGSAFVWFGAAASVVFTLFASMRTRVVVSPSGAVLTELRLLPLVPPVATNAFDMKEVAYVVMSSSTTEHGSTTIVKVALKGNSAIRLRGFGEKEAKALAQLLNVEIRPG